MARLRAEEPRELGESDEAFLGARLEGVPAASVLFRPEEVHTRSEKRRPAARRAEAVVEVSHDPRRIDPVNLAVAHLDDQGLTAVQARGIDPHRLAGKQPRD